MARKPKTKLMKEAVMNVAASLKTGNKSLTQAVQEALDTAKMQDSGEKTEETKSEEEKKDGKEEK